MNRNTMVFLVVLATLGVLTAGHAQPTLTPQPAAASQFKQSPGGAPAPSFVWLEGESAQDTNVPTNKWLNGDDPTLLSGGDALTGMCKPVALPKPCFANYRFNCPEEGTYDVWFRHGAAALIAKARYRFLRLGSDGAPAKKLGPEEGWLGFDLDAPVVDPMTIGLHRTLGWSKQAQVRMEKGIYDLEIQFTGPNPQRAADPNADIWIIIDAICLTKGPFAPSGALKPGEAEAAAAAAAATGYVWIEGEAAEKTNVAPTNIWLKGDNLTLLSRGDALVAMMKPAALPKPCFALYRFASPAEGAYDVWFRHGYMGNIGAMRFRFTKLGADGKPAAQPGPEEGWTEFDQKAKVVNRTDIGSARSIEWSKQRFASLKKGDYRMEVQITGPNPDRANDANADVWIVIDAICLTTQPFTPSGALKPGEKPPAAIVGLPATAAQ